MPVVESQSSNSSNNNQRSSRTVSFAGALVDPRREESMLRSSDMSPETGSELDAAGVTAADNTARHPPASSPDSLHDAAIDDGTGRCFRITFQEHRLRFDQKFPEGLDMRIPVSEYEVILEQIHREFIEPLDKSQTSVRKWSVATAGTAPIGVGFVLSIFLARRVNRHQKALKNFWISLRQHLKALNRDIYFVRGIEWRIEKDLEKIADREAYNKLHAFRIEIVFRKPIALRSGREIALRSIVESTRTSRSTSAASSNIKNKRFPSCNFADPELFALLSTAPGGEEYSFESDLGPEGESPAEEEEEEDRTIFSSPFLIPDHVVVPDEEGVAVTNEPLLMTVEEPSDVKAARISSVYEPPSPTPKASMFTKPDDTNMGSGKKTMTFADLLRSEEFEDIVGKEYDEIKADDSDSGVSVSQGAEISTIGAVGAAGLTAVAMAETSPRSPSPPNTPTLTSEEATSSPGSLSSSDPARDSREEAFAQRQRKKFSRGTTLATQLYDIPESPTIGSEDPIGDAMNYMAQHAGGDDLIDDILGPSGPHSSRLMTLAEMGEPKPVVTPNFEDLGSTPVAAYPMADPFLPLYETETLVPLNPEPAADPDELEFTDVDGEAEYVRRKKWRVAPESAGKLTRAQTMTQNIKPGSRAVSYRPVTVSTVVPDTIDFHSSEDDNSQPGTD